VAALGISSAALYFGLASGPLLGGWFTEIYGWRSVFIFPVIISIASFLLVFLYVKGEWKSKSPIPVDWLGTLIFTLWSCAFFIGVSIFPGINSYLMLLLGFILLIVFYLQQSRSNNPLVRFKEIMDNKIFSRSLFASTCTYASNYPLIFLFSLYLQFIKDLSPTEAGQIMIIQAVMMAFLAPLAGRLSDLFEPRIIATAGCIIMSAAFGLLMTIDTNTSLYFFSGCLMCLGLGFGMFTTPNNNAALSSVEIERLGIASALLNLSRTIGNMIGTAMMLLLVSAIIGDAKIEPSQYDSLLQVIHFALALSCLYTIFGAYFSYTRGNIRTTSA
jgi:MFS family permease